MTDAADHGLEGKRALITGAGTGIGRAIAVALGHGGCRLALHYRSHREGAESVLGATAASGTLYEADLARPGEAADLADRVIADLGGIDILVCSAGWTLDRALADTTDALFDEVVTVNLRSHYILIRELAPHLASSAGNVLMVSSIHATLGASGYSAYSATKGAINALVPALAVELAGSGVRVNGIAPGLVEVERLQEDPAFDPEPALRGIPLGRAGTPEEVAALARFVVSPSASWLTGAMLTVDGGTTGLMPLVVPENPVAPDLSRLRRESRDR